jgi:hypothetical protein
VATVQQRLRKKVRALLDVKETELDSEPVQEAAVEGAPSD